MFFANPSAEEALKDEKLETLDTNFDEVVHLPTTSQNINTNGNPNNNTGKLIVSLHLSLLLRIPLKAARINTVSSTAATIRVYINLLCSTNPPPHTHSGI